MYFVLLCYCLYVREEKPVVDLEWQWEGIAHDSLETVDVEPSFQVMEFALDEVDNYASSIVECRKVEMDSIADKNMVERSPPKVKMM